MRWGTPKHGNENWVKVTKILSLLSPDPIMCFGQFGQNPSIGSLDILQIRLIFTVLIVWWPWNLGQCNQILIKLFIYPETQSLVWIHHLVQEIGCRQAFVESKLDIHKGQCDLEMRPRSPKCNNFFPLSQWCFMQVWSISIYWFRR